MSSTANRLLFFCPRTARAFEPSNKWVTRIAFEKAELGSKKARCFDGKTRDIPIYINMYVYIYTQYYIHSIIYTLLYLYIVYYIYIYNVSILRKTVDCLPKTMLTFDDHVCVIHYNFDLGRKRNSFISAGVRPGFWGTFPDL
jgi:hypothetical protein